MTADIDFFFVMFYNAIIMGVYRFRREELTDEQSMWQACHKSQQKINAKTNNFAGSSRLALAA